MASFVLTSSSCDGHIRALSRAIFVASKISRIVLLEFTPSRMKLCAKTDMALVKFTFTKDFFTEYTCDKKHQCCMPIRALQMPFKAPILFCDRDTMYQNPIKLRCSVEDEMNNQIVFRIGADPPAVLLTYYLTINDLDPELMDNIKAMNRSIGKVGVEISPKQSKRERFLLSAFTSFAPDIDQVTFKCSQSEIKAVGSVSPQSCANGKKFSTSEFSHKKDDFSTFTVTEDLSITVPLRYLKLFLSFVETNKVQTFPKYIFEGMGAPAHFIYDATLFRGQFVSPTPFEDFLNAIDFNPELIPIAGPNESFIADENVILARDDVFDNEEFGRYLEDENEELDEGDGYNDNVSESSQLLDGNLEHFNSITDKPALNNYQPNAAFGNGSLYGGTESIRSEIGENTPYDPEKVKELLDLDQDPDEIENAVINYSDSSDG